jgi:hypothetical protein
LACNGLRWDPLRWDPWPGQQQPRLSEARDKFLTRCAEKGTRCAVGGARSNVQSPSHSLRWCSGPAVGHLRPRRRIAADSRSAFESGPTSGAAGGEGGSAGPRATVGPSWIAPHSPRGRMGAGGGQVLLGASAKAPDTCWAGSARRPAVAERLLRFRPIRRPLWRTLGEWVSYFGSTMTIYG